METLGLSRTRLGLMLLTLVGTFSTANGQVGFDKSFSPGTIGPGSTATLVFTIDNTESADPVTDLAFSDTLPAGVTIATPTNASTSCTGGVLSAPPGGDTIALTEGAVGASAVCTVRINVTSSTAGTHMNTSGDLTSSSGNSGPASADLVVTTGLPGFTKSFAPSTVEFGGRSTLTFTIDNSASASDIQALLFDDTLPTGMVVADPAFASTDCGHSLFPPTLTAAPGTSFISLFANGTGGFPALDGGASCTVTVDVIGGAVGLLNNVSGELFLDFGQTGAGKAAAVLEVTESDDLLELAKEFTDDPVPPGGAVTLEFTITNKSRVDSASEITFSDDLEASLSGLMPTLPPVPDPPCGSGSSLDFSLGVLTLTGGSLTPGGFCSFSVELTVPGDTAPGAYPNTAGPVSGDIAGSTETGNVAGGLLFVVSFPVLTKEFTDDPVGAGGTATLEFTISNPETTSAMSDIQFVDELTAGTTASGPTLGFLPFPVSVTLPPVPDPPCGLGSSLALISVGTDRQGLELTGGSLAAGNTPGDTCTFSVTIDIPEGFAGGTYTNTTEEISAVLDNFAGPPTVIGPPASGDIVVLGAPQLSKVFTDDPVAPGGVVTLEFSLENLDDVNSASAIAFSDDLGSTLTGLTLTSALENTCGGTIGGIGTEMFDYSGGSLAAEASCTIMVSLTVPVSPPGGIFSNSTSEVTATVAGVPALSAAASDNLVVSGLLFSKEFTDDPVIAGGTVSLTFTIDNTSGTEDATAITFRDPLDPEVLPGLIATLPPTPDPPCGGTLTSVLGDLFFTGGTVSAGSSCSFSVTLTVPAGTPDGSYGNITINNAATVDGVFVTLPPATADLEVNSTLLEIAKEFTDDPVPPDSQVTLEFTITNLSDTQTVTDILFDDDLDAVLTGLGATSAIVNTCGGMADSVFPSGLFEYAGGTLAPLASCTVTISVAVPAAPLPGNVFPNSTSDVAGQVGSLDVFGAPARDDLNVQLVGFSKTFDGPSSAGGTAVLTFTIENLDSANSITALGFSDDLAAVIPGLVATELPATPCGAGSALVGAGFLTFSGGNLPPGGTCSFPVTVEVPAGAPEGTFVNTTSGLFQAGLLIADPTSSSLTIEPPPVFSKSFSPNSIAFGSNSTLTFSVDNSGSAVAASSLAFTDALPAGVVVATPNGAATSCGGTVTAAGGTISFMGGSVGAGGICTVGVDVTGVASGTHINVSGDLTSSSGNSGSASATFIVGLEPGTIVINKATVPAGGTGFGFTNTVGGGGSFTLGDGETQTFAGVPVGSYTVTENDPTGLGFGLTGLTCSDSAGGGTPSSGDIGTRTASIELDPGETVTCTYTNTMGTTCFTGPTGTGTGDATLCFSGGGVLCGFSDISFIPLEGDPLSPPAGSAPADYDFSHGLVSFTITGCTPGFTADLTWELPEALATDTILWKYGPTADNTTPHWYELPATIVDGTIDFSLVDGGLGDDDLAPDGTIVAQAGPGEPEGADIEEIPTLSEWSLILLAGLLAAAGVWLLRRREAQA